MSTRLQRALVLRYHSLGDVILSTGIVRGLAARGREVEVATEATYRPIFEGNPDVSRIWLRDELERDAGSGTVSAFDEVHDLQGTAGSRRTVRKLGPGRRLQTRSLARRWMVWTGGRGPQPDVPHAVTRYAEVAGLAEELDETALAPRVYPTAADAEAARGILEHADLRPSEDAPIVALLTGASRRSKAYPRPSFLEVGNRLLEHGAQVLWIEDPRSGNGEQVGTRVATGLGPLKEILSRVDVAISGDSGPMHLATALGIPTVAIFGSSVVGFGFRPLGAETRLLEVEGLGCRPCGVHGRDRCWRGHWKCVRGIAPERVVRETLALLETSAHATRSNGI